MDKYTLRCVLHEPSAAFLADVVYYPCNLIAPDSAEQADMHPIGCGPFKFVKWERNSITELVRFENYLKPMPRATLCPTWMALSDDRKRKTRCADVPTRW